MGAFFLYKTSVSIKINSVKLLFDAKGFSPPVAYQFGSWSFLHYRKQLMAQQSFTVTRFGATLFAVGTFAYKGHDLPNSLELVLADFLDGEIEQDALVGAYCFIVFTEDRITFLNDRMNLFHIFTNDDNTVFSSSFAAVLKTRLQKFPINIPAAIENILTGYIIGPETIVQGIYLADNRYQQTFNHATVLFLQHPLIEWASRTDRQDPFNSCVDEQLAELDQYFSSFKNLVDNFGGVDIGLSGGYDSRVLLLMAQRHFNNVFAHSHFHREVSTDELCAEQIAAALDVSLYRCAEAKQPADMDIDEFEQNIENTAAFNDGRVIHDYSWLVYFRTRWYREAVLRDLRFGMNGLGGELYRNHDNHFYHKVEVREWVKARVLGAGISLSVTTQSLNNILDYILAKAGATIGEDFSRQISHQQTRRYFGELFSVYGAAVRMNIDNQLAFSLSPFLDYGPRFASYTAFPHIGLDGRFEAAMISRMNPSIAAITSSYGYPFDKRIPLNRFAKCAARGLVPYAIQNSLQNLRQIKGSHSVAVYHRVYSQQSLVQRASELMQSKCFGFIWNMVERDYVLLMRALSVGIMLIKYEDCIEI